MTTTEAALYALREVLLNVAGCLHVIDARAGTIIRWIHAPEMKPVEEAQAIRDVRKEAHEQLFDVLKNIDEKARLVIAKRDAEQTNYRELIRITRLAHRMCSCRNCKERDALVDRLAKEEDVR